MSTPCVVQVDTRVSWSEKWGDPPKERVETLCKLYRHCDGYPDGNGHQIMVALATCAIEDEGLNNRNWAQHFLARYLSCDMDAEFLGRDDKFYSEFMYLVTGPTDLTGGKEDAPDVMDDVNIKIWDSYEAGERPADLKELGDKGLLYDGNWKGMPRFMHEFAHGDYYVDGYEPPIAHGYDQAAWYCAPATKTVWNNLQALADAKSVG